MPTLDSLLPPETDQKVRIASAQLSAEIAPLGAELQRLTDAQGRELLWDGDPAYWTGRAPILFPIVGSLVGDSYRLGDRRYTLPKHGFARRSLFTPIAQQQGSVTFRLAANAATRAAYPFDFVLDISFAIEGAALTMTAAVTNAGDEPMPASFGFHPALRWPLPYGRPRDQHRVRFAQPEPAPIRRIDGTGAIRPETLPTPVKGRDLMLDDALFADDAIIFDRLESRSLTYGAPGGPALQIDFPDMPHLGLWMKPGANYLCIEPWQGHSDPIGFDGDFRDKPGIVLIDPGETRRFIMRIALAPGEGAFD
ncbi:aldose epimerase [Sphingomonas oleivorans]|uniref:Aldose epimerase n=2 Tax=Sphingomonas oleivorans TaxID=1735121 RepID=A0A2T5G3A2_9SPHN|nr:aldose epimerase [Sphingomonas oleivorans]